MLDLKVINGTLFIPGVGLVQAGVGVKDGKIVMIAADDTLPEAKSTIDAGGKYITPAGSTPMFIWAYSLRGKVSARPKPAMLFPAALPRWVCLWAVPSHTWAWCRI